ncbi:putative ubiquitin carboxyl- hydrolase CYLD [Trichinella spiralis]|uniref:putative ubiquitin carboxyl- hydrolase CYLD n=1 Tax=Trichinella spiralis TaxID=6334 RepID=UPI0001EFC4DF|nr:putative ubiquitin carboxyl- hydrolase CYLD [Trichinella spiralis]
MIFNFWRQFSIQRLQDPHVCWKCSSLANLQCLECYLTETHWLNETFFCFNCFREFHCALKSEQDHAVVTLPSIDVRSPPSPVILQLAAVLCIESSHYVSFVRVGDRPESDWIFFDSMADREGEETGYNVPEVRLFSDFSRWLSPENVDQLHRSTIDSNACAPFERLITDCYLCFYYWADARDFMRSTCLMSVSTNAFSSLFDSPSKPVEYFPKTADARPIASSFAVPENFFITRSCCEESQYFNKELKIEQTCSSCSSIEKCLRILRLTGRMKNAKIVPKPPTSTNLLQFSFESGLLVAILCFRHTEEFSFSNDLAPIGHSRIERLHRPPNIAAPEHPSKHQPKLKDSVIQLSKKNRKNILKFCIRKTDQLLQHQCRNLDAIEADTDWIQCSGEQKVHRSEVHQTIIEVLLLPRSIPYHYPLI